MKLAVAVRTAQKKHGSMGRPATTGSAQAGFSHSSIVRLYADQAFATLVVVAVLVAESREIVAGVASWGLVKGAVL